MAIFYLLLAAVAAAIKPSAHIDGRSCRPFHEPKEKEHAI